MTEKYIIDGYEPVIGLEVHAQLTTYSKIFCGCKVEYGAPPNSLTCPVCLGLPGALPTLNKKAVEYAMKMILAVGGTVRLRSLFARKNYFYPDLPKGYQISQYDRPLGEGGIISFKLNKNGTYKTVRLKRIHLEEDAGKLLHPEDGENYSRVDLNRCGVPLIEIVTEPDISSPQEAYRYLVKLKQILQYLEICTADMEKGHLRCDANVSVRPAGAEQLGIKTEVKNMNSFKGVERALTFEIERQTSLLKSGGIIEQSTLLWDDKRQRAEVMRSKEEAQDYRYFPEPDLVNLVIDNDWLDRTRGSLPELAETRARRFVEQYHIPEYDAGVLTEYRELADYYEAVMKEFDNGKVASNWIMTELLKVINEEKADISEFRLRPMMMAELLKYIQSGEVSGKIAKEIFAEMIISGRSAGEIIKEKRLVQISDDTFIGHAIDKVIAENEDNINKYLSGKNRLFGYFVGQVMKETDGKANPEMVNKLLKEKLDELAR
ncbi:MAG: Asp-tRNA(Asn)/Glu-tRNA(Gln) amidotransferase subunit GatB [candidate division Zixibacteria bacterium]|nr:Asp-tRNA(Asn)/Glu-tRNA(Gln) amidotransferase subunit GatB [candidate division Zixibacteria bacterium]